MVLPLCEDDLVTNISMIATHHMEMDITSWTYSILPEIDEPERAYCCEDDAGENDGIRVGRYKLPPPEK